LELLHSGSVDVETLASGFDAVAPCLVCGTEIVDAGAFESAIAEHYEVDTLDREVEEALINSGVEVGHFDSPHLCAYHGEQLSKDD
jgi:deoxycytidylate deaminase